MRRQTAKNGLLGNSALPVFWALPRARQYPFGQGTGIDKVVQWGQIASHIFPKRQLGP